VIAAGKCFAVSAAVGSGGVWIVISRPFKVGVKVA
jgi:hypothetical protein